MGRLEKNTYTEQAEDSVKHRLVGYVRAKAAELARLSDKEDRQAEEAMYRVLFRRAK